MLSMKTTSDVRSATKQFEALGSDQRGLAAIEFAFFASILSFALLSMRRKWARRQPGKPAT
jgi:Flp pilus assembly protein TadG